MNTLHRVTTTCPRLFPLGNSARVQRSCWLFALVILSGCNSGTNSNRTSKTEGKNPPDKSRVATSTDQPSAGDLGSSSLKTATSGDPSPTSVEVDLKGDSEGNLVKSSSNSPTDSDSSIPKIIPTQKNPLQFLSPAVSKDALELREEARQLAQFLVDQAPANPNAFETKARLHLLLGEREEAKLCWNKALELDPEYFFAFQGLGQVALATNQIDTARVNLERAAKALPSIPEIHHDLSSAQLKAGLVDEAIATLSEFAARNPASAQTFLLLGHAQLAKKLYAEAKTSFEKALELSPDAPRALEGLGRALVRLGERQRARELLLKQKKARAEEQKNRSAEESFELELKEYASKYSDVAKVLLSANKIDFARPVLMKAVKLDPQNTEAWTNLISIPQSAGRFVDAMERAREMTKVNPESASAFFTLGILSVKARDLATAIESLRKVTELAPEDVRGFEALARLLIQNRTQVEEGMSHAERAVELRGNAADYEIQAQAYVLNKRLSDAHRSLERAVELDPGNQIYQGALNQLNQFIKAQDN